MRLLTAALSLVVTAALAAPASAAPADPQADLQNMADSYGRITGPGGQLQNPAYLPSLIAATTGRYVEQLLTQVASPLRLSLTAGNLVPGWNVGNPLRAGWTDTRGQSRRVAFTNRYGALLRGTVWRPLPGATDPYTGRKLTGPFPGVVITTGSIQGSQGMYEWLAQDLAERGYVVLTYDVQGQGTSETLPHEDSPLNQPMVPFCNPLDCHGVPSQQLGNFTTGTEDALDFFVSRPKRQYPNENSEGASSTSPYNPFWRSYDAKPVAIVGHSLGATAVSQVQGTDERVATVVALDKLSSDGVTPRVPALAIQSEYFFEPTPAGVQPDPGRERATGYDAWEKAGVDTMLVVPRASTHLEYTDIPLVLPASRYGQDLTSVYVQRWLAHYLKGASAAPLLDTSFRYLEPVGNGVWKPVRLQRDELLSSYYCSAYSFGGVENGDIADVGC
ncbi:dienelactone hydrolase family protein [Nocardioides sp. SR21]|uniref:dienelactone hydrolase family protein n=1 Tax=Nocardioides sp. SR21 TaxID=2919501 RepID=UPI001FAAE57F|nr:alpha/beta hydrolase [Nocardioides sp. SR21]